MANVDHVIVDGVRYDIEDTHARDLVDQLQDTIDSYFVAMLNADNYTAMMKLWFQLHGSAPMTEYSSLLDRWYTITRTGWEGGTRFDHASKSMASTGTKVGDNADMVAEPSTNTVKGRDDYANLPLFHVVDCNWTLDASGKPKISAIEGVAGLFERTNPDKLVGVLQMTGYHKYVDDISAGTYTHMYTDAVDADGYTPLPESIDLDGTVRAWIVHAKYASGDDYCCYSGARTWIDSASYNSVITNFHAKHGLQYGGKTSADDAFLKLMFFLKYASLSADGILQGCVNYNYQYTVAVEETGVERVILTAAQAENIRVGSTVMVGNPTAFSSGTTLNRDRGQAGMRAKVDRKKVVSKETLSGGNVAINIDNGGVTFDTTANTITTTGDAPTYVSTAPWHTGTCDNVRGADGSPTTPGTGAEPVKLQGIEYAMGAYEIVSDCILKYRKDGNNKYWLGVYVCRDASKYATSITNDYELVGFEIECPASSGYQYIAEHGYDPDHPEVWFPHLIGCTSSQRTKDAIYIVATSESSCMWQVFGILSAGTSYGGFSTVAANSGLSSASWYIHARLSATGNRGELAA